MTLFATLQGLWENILTMAKIDLTAARQTDSCSLAELTGLFLPFFAGGFVLSLFSSMA